MNCCCCLVKSFSIFFYFLQFSCIEISEWDEINNVLNFSGFYIGYIENIESTWSIKEKNANTSE